MKKYYYIWLPQDANPNTVLGFVAKCKGVWSEGNFAFALLFPVKMKNGEGGMEFS